MKKLLSTHRIFLINLIVVVVISGCNFPSRMPFEAPVVDTRVVQGKLMKIDGRTYILKTQEGLGFFFQANPDTLVDESMQVGDQITVSLSKQGEPIAMRKDR